MKDLEAGLRGGWAGGGRSSPVAASWGTELGRQLVRRLQCGDVRDLSEGDGGGVAGCADGGVRRGICRGPISGLPRALRHTTHNRDCLR